MGRSAFRRGLNFCAICLGILGASSLVIGTFLILDTQSVDNLPNFEKRQCTLNAVKVIKVGSDCGYTVVWQDKDSGVSAIASPFSVADSKAIAITRMIDYPLHYPVDCLCTTTGPKYPNVGGVQECGMWNACILDTRLGEHLQADGRRFKLLAELLLAFSGFGIITCLVIGVLNCCCGAAIENCCGKSGRNRSVNADAPPEYERV